MELTDLRVPLATSNKSVIFGGPPQILCLLLGRKEVELEVGVREGMWSEVWGGSSLSEADFVSLIHHQPVETSALGPLSVTNPY